MFFPLNVCRFYMKRWHPHGVFWCCTWAKFSLDVLTRRVAPTLKALKQGGLTETSRSRDCPIGEGSSLSLSAPLHRRQRCWGCSERWRVATPARRGQSYGTAILHGAEQSLPLQFVPQSRTGIAHYISDTREIPPQAARQISGGNIGQRRVGDDRRVKFTGRPMCCSFL